MTDATERYPLKTRMRRAKSTIRLRYDQEKIPNGPDTVNRCTLSGTHLHQLAEGNGYVVRPRAGKIAATEGRQKGVAIIAWDRV